VRAALVAVVTLVALVSSAGASRESASSGPSFERARTYATGGAAAAFAVGDLTGDAKPDLVSANGSRAHSVSVLINKGNGSFRAKREYGTGRGPESVAIGDLNADGSRDIATANHAANTVSVLLNNGDGSLRPRRDYATGRGTGSVAVDDVNGDGKPDLVTANTDSKALSTVSVLLNNGDGSLRPRSDYATGRGTRSVAVDDVNGDGKPDLVSAGIGDAYGISVLLNTGDGTFQAKRDFGPGLLPEDLAIGDLNGDSKADLAIVNANGDLGLTVFLNAGDGTFPAMHDYRTFEPTSIEIGDVSGDGKPDLLVTYSEKESGPGVFVYLNRGHGRFRTGVTYPLHGDWATGGTWVAIGDLNGDRKADLAVTSRIHAVSVLVNVGDGRFRKQLDYETGYPWWPAISDLNGDGRRDLVVGHGSTVSVLVNKPGLCNVQDLRRQTLKAAKRTMARVNCRVGKVNFDYSRTIKGLVIWQKPKLGAVLPRASRVDVVISRGGR
jgi:hypothetical protein